MHLMTQSKPSMTRVGGRRIEFRVRYSPAATRRRIQVSPAGVIVILPRGQSQKDAAGLLKQNATWVKLQMESVARLSNLRTKRRPSVLFRGEELDLVIQRSIEKRAEVKLDPGTIAVQVPADQDAIQVLERWMRRQAREVLTTAVARRAAQMKVRPHRLFIRGQRTKWGNCSRLRNLSFNWRLVMAPPEVVDYIVVHELTHLKEPSHSPKFWLLVQSVCPNFAQHSEWLRSNEHRVRLTRNGEAQVKEP